MKIRNFVALLALAGLIASPAYAKKDDARELPRGLQKKAEKGKPLPPGWQKKLVVGQVMDVAVYERCEIVIPVDSGGLITVRIEGKLVRLYEATREVVEVLESM